MDERGTPDPESLRLELQEAMVTFRHWTSQATQATGIIATGDALLITYGFAQRQAGILLVASAMPLVVLAIYLAAMSVAPPLINLAMRLERRLLIREDSLAVTYARMHLRPPVSRTWRIEDLNDEEVRNLNMRIPLSQLLRKRIPIGLYVSTISQIGLFILSLVIFHHRFM